MADDPYDIAGMRRLPMPWDAPSAPVIPAPPTFDFTGNQPVQATPPPIDYHNFAADPNEFDKMVHSSALNFGSVFPAVGGLARNLYTPGTGDELLRSAAGMQRRAQEEGPEVQSLKDVHGAGDFALWAANAGIGLAPDLALAAATGGVGGALAKKAVTGVVESAAKKAALRAGVEEIAPRAAQILAERAAPAAAKAAVAGRLAGTAAGFYPDVVAHTATADEGGAIGGDRATQLKILAGSIPAAVAGALPEFRALGQLTRPFEIGVNKTAQSFLPKLAKETAIQGSLGAGAGLAQTAITLATHKWVNDNVQLMSPQAVDQYIESAIGGGILGAATGAGIEGARALPGVRAIGGGLKEGLAKFAEWRESAYQKAKAAGENVKGYVDALKDKIPDRKEEDVGPTPAGEAFKRNLDAFEQGKVDAAVAAPRAPAQNPYPLGSPMQDMLATFIPKDHPLWGVEDTFKPMMASVERVLGFGKGEPTWKDAAHMDALRQHAPEIADKWAAAAAELKQRGADVNKVVAARGDEAPTADAEATREELAGGHVPGVAETETPAKAARLGELRTQLQNTPAAAPEFAKTQEAFREQLLNDASVVQHAGNEKSKAFFAKKVQHPATVEVEPVGTIDEKNTAYARVNAELKGQDPNAVEPVRKAPERQAIDLSNLLQQHRAQVGAATGERLSLRDALLGAIGDVHMAGLKIKPESIRPGDFGKTKGGEELGRLSPADALYLRGKVAEAAKARNQKPFAPADPEAHQAKLDERFARETAERPQEDDETKAAKRVARELPPQTVLPTKESVSSLEGVHNISAKQPYNAQMARAREVQGNAKLSPAQRREALHQIGAEIGKAELDRQQATGTINDRRYASELKRLNDIDSGASTKALRDAAFGKFDSVKVSEQRADAAEPQGHDDSRAAEKLPESKVPDHAEKTAPARADADIEAGLKAASGKDPHDYEKHTAMANAVLEKLGIKAPVKVEALTPEVRKAKGLSDNTKALYSSNDGHTIYMDPALRGPARIEALSHELGHHVIEHELGQNWEKAPAELRNALMADFEKWKAQQEGRSSAEVLASRKPLFRSQEVAGQKGELARDYLLDQHEWLADHLARALTQHETSRGVIGQFFKGIADKLKSAYDALFAGDRAKYAPAESVQKWVNGLFDAAKETTDTTATKRFVKDRLTSDERNILDRALNKGTMIQQLQKIYADNPTARREMLDAKEGLENRIAYAYKAFKDGKLQIGGRTLTVFNGIKDNLLTAVGLAGDGQMARRLFEDMANGRINASREAGKKYDVRQLEANERGNLQHAVNAGSKALLSVSQPLKRVFEGQMDRLHQTGVPAIRAVAGLLHAHTGQTGEDPGYIGTVTHRTDNWLRAYEGAVGDLSPREQRHYLQTLQEGLDKSVTGNAKVDAAVARTRALFKKAFVYAKNAGMDIGERENFAPVIMDVKDGAAETRLRTLLSDPKFEAGIREVTGDGKAPIKDLVDRLVQSAVKNSPGKRGAESIDPVAPAFSHANERVMQFIYDHGTPDQIREFAKLQTKNVADVASRYFIPLVRSAESVRRFGRSDATLDKMLAEAKTQGATDEQINMARYAVDAARGRVGLDGSPVLKKLFGKDFADKIANPTSRRGIAFAQAYQNARLLPLSLLSSLVDPMGIAVRTGGDFKTAWDGFKVGMKSLYDKQTREDIHAQLAVLGSTEDFLASELLNNGFGDVGSTGGARKINDFIFKANGLAGWTRATRYMALQSAHGFLLKHAGRPGDVQSQRFLDELGIRAGDISPGSPGRVRVMDESQRAAATPAERLRDDRVRSALMRFVDEAILRPNSQQAPAWMADPYMGLVSQYKAFAYAIHDQIGGRIMHELQHGNPAAVLPAMAYLPVVVASEMLRGFIQYGPGGNPQRADWGPEDYAKFGFLKSGLAGPEKTFGIETFTGRSPQGGFPGAAFLGPTAQQAHDLVTKSPARNAERALPGETVFNHWN